MYGSVKRNKFTEFVFIMWSLDISLLCLEHVCEMYTRYFRSVDMLNVWSVLKVWSMRSFSIMRYVWSVWSVNII